MSPMFTTTGQAKARKDTSVALGNTTLFIKWDLVLQLIEGQSIGTSDWGAVVFKVPATGGLKK